MSILKSLVLAVLAFGIAGGASAAENKFLAPNTVEAIVSGEIISRYTGMQQNEQRSLLRNYLIGFGSGMHAECGVLSKSVEAETLKVVRNVMGRHDDSATAMRAGFDDARLLAGKYGCASNVGQAASRTVVAYMQ
jgi:hypothetical protein